MDVFNSDDVEAVPTSPFHPRTAAPQAPSTPSSHPATLGPMVSPLPKHLIEPSTQKLLLSNLYCQDCSNKDDQESEALDDTKSQRQNCHQQRPLQNNEYSYPIRSAVTRIHEDKIEDLHKSLKTVLSSTALIHHFYEDLRCRLKAQNIPLRE